MTQRGICLSALTLSAQRLPHEPVVPNAIICFGPPLKLSDHLFVETG